MPVCVSDCIFSDPLMAFEMHVSVFWDSCCSLPGDVCVEEHLCVCVSSRWAQCVESGSSAVL